MPEKLIDSPCAVFVGALASRAPVPGGGGAAALMGAVGTALCAMVGNLTVGRKKYADVETDVRRILKKSALLQSRLLDLVDRDAEAFEPLSRAYAFPKENPARETVLAQATAAACAAPLEMMESCCQAIDLLEEMLDKGSVTLVSDVGCGALCCKAALESAGLNVFVNTKTLRDRRRAAKLDAKADALLAQYVPKAERIAAEVLRRLRGEV